MLELTERTCGLLHPQISRVLEIMATCYKQLDKYPEAIQCIQRSLVISEIHNDGSPEGNTALFNITGRLAEMYILSGQLEIGKQLLVKTEEQSKEIFGESSFERGRALNSLAVAHERAEEFVEAEAKLTEAIALEGFGQTKDQEKLGIVSDSYFNLGTLLCERSRHVDALPHLKRCLEMRVRASLPRDHPDIVAVNEMIERAKKGGAA
jgi:tetratricopeptide (TPR) repeat protein